MWTKFEYEKNGSIIPGGTYVENTVLASNMKYCSPIKNSVEMKKVTIKVGS